MKEMKREKVLEGGAFAFIHIVARSIGRRGKVYDVI